MPVGDLVYATYVYAKEIYGQSYVDECCDRDLDGEIDTDSFDRALARATNTINMYISGRVALPFVKIPESVKRWCVDLAVEDLCATADVATTQRTKRAELARKELLLVSQGKLRIVQDDNHPAPDSVDPLKSSLQTEHQRASVISPSTRQFTRTRLRGL